MPATDQASRVDDLLATARAGVRRVAPAEMTGGALVVDTRPSEQRAKEGALPGAVVVERNVLEWRLDPTSPHRLPEATGFDVRVIVVCSEGYASSLAAQSLRRLGLTGATDLEGGYLAWKALNAASGRARSG